MPGNFKNTPANQLALEELFSDPNIKRIAGHASSLFKTYFPRMHAYYQETLEALLKAHPHLRPAFLHDAPGGGHIPWCAASPNVGERVVTFPHTDQANLAAGICVVAALKGFNPDKGGHLIFWDLGLVVRFPPGTVILLPSALLLHSNVQIMDDEERCSLTLYSAGGLFRWVYNGFCSDKTVSETADHDVLARREVERAGRWAEGLARFSMLSDFSS
jgi:hypothetical protein